MDFLQHSHAVLEHGCALVHGWLCAYETLHSCSSNPKNFIRPLLFIEKHPHGLLLYQYCEFLIFLAKTPQNKKNSFLTQHKLKEAHLAVLIIIQHITTGKRGRIRVKWGQKTGLQSTHTHTYIHVCMQITGIVFSHFFIMSSYCLLFFKFDLGNSDEFLKEQHKIEILNNVM